MRANRSSMARPSEFGAVLPKRRDGRVRLACSRTGGRSDDLEHASADEGNSTHRHRRRDAAGGGGEWPPPRRTSAPPDRADRGATKAAPPPQWDDTHKTRVRVLN